MSLRAVSRLISYGSFALVGLIFAALYFGKLDPSVVMPLFIGIMVVSILSRLVLGVMQAKPSLERIRAALTGDTDPALGQEWHRGVATEESSALEVFTGERLPGDASLVGESSGIPARISYHKLAGDGGGNYLLTFAAVRSQETPGTVVAMRGKPRPWQRLSADLTAMQAGHAELGPGWRIVASDPKAVDAVITPQAANALAQSRTSVVAVVWVDGEVTVIEEGNRTSPTRLAQLLRLGTQLVDRPVA